jgi:hypothetical protein
VNLAFDLAVAPRQDNSGVHRLFVAPQFITEVPNLQQARSACLIKPGL